VLSGLWSEGLSDQPFPSAGQRRFREAALASPSDHDIPFDGVRLIQTGTEEFRVRTRLGRDHVNTQPILVVVLKSGQTVPVTVGELP
jgi:hypothetical protein